MASTELPDGAATAQAKADRGRAEVVKVLDWWEPPSTVTLHTHTSESGRPEGGVPPGTFEDPAAADRIKEITDWFAERDVRLEFDHTGDVWVAAMIPEDFTVGALDAGFGETPLDAAENAFERRGNSERDVTIQPAPATAHAEIPSPTVQIVEVGIAEERDEAMQITPQTAERRRTVDSVRAPQIAADHHIHIGWISTPSGGFIVVVHNDVHELIDIAVGDNPDDLILTIAEQLRPPTN